MSGFTLQPSFQQQYQQQQYSNQQPMLHPQQPPPPNSEHYGSYGQQTHQNTYQMTAWQCMSAEVQTEEEFRAFYEKHKDKTLNAIQAEELMYILNETPSVRAFYGISWSLELCKIMIAMLDRSKDGLMQYPEFRELLQCLNHWYQMFCQYDTNRSGFMEANELGRCIRERFQYRLSPQVYETLLKRYSKAVVMQGGQVRPLIAFDDYVSCLVRLRAYTEAFRARDRNCHNNTETGNCHFDYDDFLRCVMCL